MGQRVNYIFKNEDGLTIHYNHWRAISIASDLYLGEKKFLEFVNECQINEEIIKEPWIEGCVIIDKVNKELFFWSFEFSIDASVVDYYLQQLSKKWEGWTLQILENRMYDAEKVLGIDYISKQDLTQLDIISKEEIEEDIVADWVSTLIIIKEGENLLVTKTGSICIEDLVSYGQELISLLKNKPQYSLPKEGDNDSYQCIIIDTDKRKVLINDSINGLKESFQSLWPDYDLIIGDFRYLNMLKEIGINTDGISLSEAEIKEKFSEMVQNNDSFDPFELAERISNEHEDVQFNPDFFDNVKPKKSIVEKLKSKILKMFK